MDFVLKERGGSLEFPSSQLSSIPTWDQSIAAGMIDPVFIFIHYQKLIIQLEKIESKKIQKEGLLKNSSKKLAILYLELVPDQQDL